jgi:DNA repair protein RecO (recombination protein O)
MEWNDEGIVLSVRRHGETSAVADLLTREHGRHGGLVKGGAGKAARGALQPGNRLLVTWKARLEEHLGNVTWELVAAHGAAWLDDRRRLAGLAAACAMAEATLPEREPHSAAFNGLVALLGGLADEDWPCLYVHWELGLLAELGFGLDLSRCAATGANDGLAYVSPRSGRAVSLSAGEPYRGKLLPLPAFLLEGRAGTAEEVLAGLCLTGHFLERHVLGPHGKALPAARSRLVERLQA